MGKIRKFISGVNIPLALAFSLPSLLRCDTTVEAQSHRRAAKAGREQGKRSQLSSETRMVSGSKELQRSVNEQLLFSLPQGEGQGEGESGAVVSGQIGTSKLISRK